MAQAVISNKNSFSSTITPAPGSSYGDVEITDATPTVVITKKQSSATIKAATAFSYGIISVTGPSPTVQISETIPYRIRFTNIGIPSYNANNIPGIGIQVIGYSNFIL